MLPKYTPDLIIKFAERISFGAIDLWRFPGAVPELRMCESKMTRRNVPDPNWETQVLRKVMWEIMKVKTVLSTF